MDKPQLDLMLFWMMILRQDHNVILKFIICDMDIAITINDIYIFLPLFDSVITDRKQVERRGNDAE